MKLRHESLCGCGRQPAYSWGGDRLLDLESAREAEAEVSSETEHGRVPRLLCAEYILMFMTRSKICKDVFS